MQYDITIIGAGIVGLATAYQLSERQPDLKICVVEKENRLTPHQTSHNSGVIHSGVYYQPGGDKALNCSKGYRYLLDFCDKHEVPYDLCGKVVVATQQEQRPLLDNIFQRGLANGLQGIRKIGPEETHEIEPHVQVVEAIHVPEAGIIDYAEVAQKYWKCTEGNGGVALLGQPVEHIHRYPDEVIVVTPQQRIRTKVLVTCAGLHADKLAKMTGQAIDFKILPFRGEYYLLNEDKKSLVNNLIYPVPNPAFPFLGVHSTPRIDGRIELGPNAVLAFRREGYNRWQLDWSELWETVSYSGFRQIATKFWKTGLEEQFRSFSKKAFVKAIQELIPAVQMSDVQRGGSGVRAQACDAKGNLLDDFLILEQQRIVNVCNAPSPAATSSLAIGETVAEKALRQFNDL